MFYFQSFSIFVQLLFKITPRKQVKTIKYGLENTLFSQ